MKDTLGTGVDGKVLLICMQVSSLVARICFGMVSDVSFIRKNRILLQQVSYLKKCVYKDLGIRIKPPKVAPKIMQLCLFIYSTFLGLVFGYGYSHNVIECDK